jgi:hypothetical protein
MDIRVVHIPPLGLAWTLRVPRPAHGLVIFVHGSGSSRPHHHSLEEGAVMPFRDRADAGRKLSLALRKFRGHEVVVLALPAVGFRSPRKSRRHCTRPST